MRSLAIGQHVPKSPTADRRHRSQDDHAEQI
jgi:hypothetical protein